MTSLLPPLKSALLNFDQVEISEGRKVSLLPLIEYIRQKIETSANIRLNFICTHNSRRSQFAQVWATVAATHFNLPIKCYSGGTEVTACNPRTIASLRRSGFTAEATIEANPVYSLYYSNDLLPLQLYSKLYDDPANPSSNFAAVMTCDHAEANCPLIPGAEFRIPLSYNDPKAFDDSPEEASRYDERSMQIGSEMYYVMQQIN